MPTMSLHMFTLQTESILCGSVERPPCIEGVLPSLCLSGDGTRMEKRQPFLGGLLLVVYRSPYRKASDD